MATTLRARPAALNLTPRVGAVGTAGSTLIATAIRGVMLNRRARLTLGIAPSLVGAIGLFRRASSGTAEGGVLGISGETR